MKKKTELTIEDFRHDNPNTYEGDKAVRINVRMPASLRDAAKAENINFSKVLRAALEKILGHLYKKGA